VKILLDENFPLGLVRALQADALDVDHIITLGIRGASDQRIREQLSDPELIFLNSRRRLSLRRPGQGPDSRVARSAVAETRRSNSGLEGCCPVAPHHGARSATF